MAGGRFAACSYTPVYSLGGAGGGAGGRAWLGKADKQNEMEEAAEVGRRRSELRCGEGKEAETRQCAEGERGAGRAGRGEAAPRPPDWASRSHTPRHARAHTQIERKGGSDIRSCARSAQTHVARARRERGGERQDRATVRNQEEKTERSRHEDTSQRSKAEGKAQTQNTRKEKTRTRRRVLGKTRAHTLLTENNNERSIQERLTREHNDRSEKTT